MSTNGGGILHKESLAFYIAVLRKYFISYCSDRVAQLGVTNGQLFILIYISKKKKCAPKEISSYLRFDAGQLNRTLSKLIEKNLIIQKKNENDRRANVLELTEQGKKVVESSRDLFYEWDEQILSHLTIEQRQQLLDQLHNLVHQTSHDKGGNL